MILKITPSVDYLMAETFGPNEPTDQNLIKVSKVGMPSNKRTLL